ncbi:MAG: Flp family type IVb pilin [Longimicrobiales bacterium]
MTKLYALMQRLQSDESGQGLVEYVLIIALVAIGLVAAMLIFRNAIGNTFTNVTAVLNNAPAGSFNAS